MLQQHHYSVPCLDIASPEATSLPIAHKKPASWGTAFPVQKAHPHTPENTSHANTETMALAGALC